METAQLPLLAELSLNAVDDSTPQPRARKFVGTTNPRHWTAILALLRNPLPCHQLQRISDTDNSTELLDELRQLGLELPCHQVPMYDAGGEAVVGAVYALTLRDVRLINRCLAKGGGQNA